MTAKRKAPKRAAKVDTPRPETRDWQEMAERYDAAVARIAELADYQDALRADRIPFAEAYAVAARAEEREACARICDGLITGHKSAAAIRARGSQPEACGARVPGGDGLCCQPAGHAGRHDTGSASWPRLPCDDMQPERIAPAEKPAREVVGYRVRYGVGYHEECSRCGGMYPEGEEHTDEECVDYLLASRRAERIAHAHHEATAFWRGVCAERASVDDQGAEYWSDPGDLRKWAAGLPIAAYRARDGRP